MPRSSVVPVRPVKGALGGGVARDLVLDVGEFSAIGFVVFLQGSRAFAGDVVSVHIDPSVSSVEPWVGHVDSAVSGRTTHFEIARPVGRQARVAFEFRLFVERAAQDEQQAFDFREILFLRLTNRRSAR